MKITSEKTADALIAYSEGRLDTMTASEFEKKILNEIQNMNQDLLLDFSKIEYVSSAGLRSLLVIAKEQKKNEKEMVICGLLPTIAEVFRISGFDKIIPLVGTLDEGLQFLKTT